VRYIIGLAFLVLAAAGSDVLAAGRLAQIAIIDRRNGAELVPYFYRGEYWVAGTPGTTYAIEIRNRLSERLLAVTSVDGVNVISGATAGWDQTGYVFDPGEGYQITGWRKSDAEVAAFTFTASPNSYAERTGRPANVGVIGVALFRERMPPHVYVAPPAPMPDESFSSGVPSPSASPSAASSAAPPPASAAREAAPHARSDINASPPPDSYATLKPRLGTGHGEREASYINHTEFERMQPEPNEVIRIRYDSFENLVAMGVIPRPHQRVPVAANPFPGSSQQEYVPDPP